MLRLTWTETGLDDLEWWAKHDPRKLKRIIEICLAACRTPTAGIGKPEPLRFDFQGYWSRRIDQEHRLAYAFDETDPTAIQCRFHYRPPDRLRSIGIRSGSRYAKLPQYSGHGKCPVRLEVRKGSRRGECPVRPWFLPALCTATTWSCAGRGL